jgi:non-heme chloroperoxidase
MKHFIQTTFKTSDGVNLSYLRAGNGLPVILLHGFLESGACFKSQAQILAEQYDVIVLDQRSHGESEKVPFGLQVARLSKDLFELVTALNLERVSLLGHSMGAAVIYRMTDWSLGPNPTMFARDASFRSFMPHFLLHFLIP